MNEIRIAYQGIEGSYSEIAARKFCERQNFLSPVLVPCISSKNVVTALEEKRADFGVVAIENSTAGRVQETEEALKDVVFDVVAKTEIPIIHCLFVHPRFAENNQSITEILSHPQALAQSKATIEKNFSRAKTVPTEDTALAAQKLAAEAYGMTTGVLCSKRAGELYGLKLVEEGVQDRNDNQTTFILFSIKKPAL